MNWIMSQEWSEAYFLNFKVDRLHLLPLLPKGIELDQYEGQNYVSLIPFYMKNTHLRFMSTFGFKTFPEVNLRTYVKYQDKAGVLFLSLDSTHHLFNKLVRSFCEIPYIDSYITYQDANHNRKIHLQREGFKLDCELRYDPIQKVSCELGSFEYWIAERYYFFNAQKGKTMLWEVEHKPWEIFRAEGEISKFHYDQVPLNLRHLRKDFLYSPGVQTRAFWGKIIR